MPTTAQKAILLGSRTRAQIVDALIASFAPVGWWSMRATSGTNEPNRGSAGSAANMTITSATLGQTGQLGAAEAALMDGANSQYQTPNLAALANLTTWEWALLVNPSSAGEGNTGTLFSWANTETSNEPGSKFGGAGNILQGYVFNTVPTAFQTISTTTLSLNAWQLIFVAYDNAGDRKLHFYKGISGTVNEMAYSAQPALTGTYRTPAGALNLWNKSNQAATWAGLADEGFVVSGNLAAAQRTALVVAAGV